MVMDGVLFDFHGTLVVAGSLEEWLGQAEDASGDGVDQEVVLPVLRQVWSRSAQRHPDACWDLDPNLHRQVFEQVLVEDAGCSAALASSLYDLMPRQWTPAPGAVDLLAGLRRSGRRIGLLSNTALDLRARLDDLGLLEFLDCVVLSFEVGLVKPDPAIFELTANQLGVAPSRCVYVGDSPSSDGGAVTAGMTCLLVPTVGDAPYLGLAAELLGCS